MLCLHEDPAALRSRSSSDTEFCLAVSSLRDGSGLVNEERRRFEEGASGISSASGTANVRIYRSLSFCFAEEACWGRKELPTSDSISDSGSPAKARVGRVENGPATVDFLMVAASDPDSGSVGGGVA